jgi:hypothetical protein
MITSCRSRVPGAAPNGALRIRDRHKIRAAAAREALVVDVRNEWPQLRYDRAQGAAVAAMSLYAYWRKVGDAALVLAKTVANLLNIMALPRGLEPLFSP